MTEEEYREFLTALATKYLRVSRLDLGPDGSVLQHDIDRLSATARFVRLVDERSDNATLLRECAEELRSIRVDHIVGVMDRAGILDALEEAPDITFQNLRKSAIPREDSRLLRRAGFENPSAEITIVIQYARTRLASPQTSPTEIMRRAQPELERAGEAMDKLAARAGTQDSLEKPKKRKIFNGIGKLLGGAITAAGNVLLATGTVAAPNPATAYGALGSSALAVAMIGQGIGDLRGE
jgi:hypothetical protein